VLLVRRCLSFELAASLLGVLGGLGSRGVCRKNDEEGEKAKSGSDSQAPRVP